MESQDGVGVIPDVIVFPEYYPTPSDPNPPMPALDDLHFAEVLFDVTTGVSDLRDEQCLRHIWWHELEYVEDDGKIEKDIYNAYDDSLSLRTRAIDYSRISDVS